MSIIITQEFNQCFVIIKTLVLLSSKQTRGMGNRFASLMSVLQVPRSLYCAWVLSGHCYFAKGFLSLLHAQLLV